MNNTAVGICGFVVPVIVANFVGTNYTMIFTLMAVFLIIIAIVGGVLMPELGEKGKLAQQGPRAAQISASTADRTCQTTGSHCQAAIHNY